MDEGIKGLETMPLNQNKQKRVIVTIEFDADSLDEAVFRISHFKESFGANLEIEKVEKKEAKP